ncbi:HAD family hydrolase [Clostridium pasteurianum]|uniref:Haloacid dehalogenase superfamily enzyme, subfamily IA n=1 Tax=Clostridium pasteurianum BC1 TaxID=86416 RepID=R4K9K0_CLOPA|nr:HAD family phosphatase [Clostridium pasteurianum]AGK96320.1 haloacid dehalogenase superfamily enzyme, subfamily IA [Clostridium pasteurianum BC1]
MLKAVIFDMDGVLIDSEPDHLRIHEKMLESLGIEPSSIDHSKYVGVTTNYKWSDIKSKYDLSYSVQELVDINRNNYFKYITSEDAIVEAISGVDKLVKNIHNDRLKLAVASSSPINVIETVAKCIGLEKYFDVLVSGDYVKRSKPNPDIFLYAAEKLEINPENCLVVEDSHNGSIAAKRAGMKCVGYKNINSANQDISSADLIIDSFNKVQLEELKKLFVE